MTTFYSLILNFVALQQGQLSGSVGELGHAAFYAMIQAVDAELSAQMHDAQERATFTLSPLMGFGRRVERSQAQGRGQGSGEAMAVQAGDVGWLRVTLLDDKLFSALVKRLLTQSQPQIQLGRIACAITDVLGSPESHPWAGYTTLESLRGDEGRGSPGGYPLQKAEGNHKQKAEGNHKGLPLQDAPRRWVVDFASPTAIRWGEASNGTRRVEIFPMPRMMVAGLRTRWDRLTGEEWGRAFEEWVERNVVVARVWRWETATVSFQRQVYTGGLGRLEYRLLDTSDAAAARHLDRLLRFGFYTGIGTKTTHGLGQMRVIESG